MNRRDNIQAPVNGGCWLTGEDSGGMCWKSVGQPVRQDHKSIRGHLRHADKSADNAAIFDMRQVYVKIFLQS